MRIVFFTRAGFQSNQLFLYTFAKIAARFEDVYIVAVYPQKKWAKATAALVRRYWGKMQRLGFANSLEIFSSYPIQLLLSSRDQKAVEQMLRALPRPAVQLDNYPIHHVSTINGPDAEQTIYNLEPDVIIQAGAGILRPQIFQLARLGTINLHHGIAPLIRGMDSIYWGLWERRPEWLGATVHWVDAGIDTGNVLAYAPVEPCFPGAGYADLYVQATQKGVERLVDTLDRLASGELWVISPPVHSSTYRSTMSGWKRMALQCRLVIQRISH